MPTKSEDPCDFDTLMWEYLDGDTTQERLSQLEAQLKSSERDRKTFVEHSQLHAMLHDFFKAEPVVQAEPVVRRKRRKGKSNAA